MATDPDQVAAFPDSGTKRGLASIGYFLLHYLEMCVVMCAGGIVVLSALLSWGGAWIGVPEPREQFPEVSTMLLAIWLTVLMVVWMRFRKHEWRSSLEMASTSVVALPLVTGAAWLGAIPRNNLFSLECGLACVFMIVPMLLRLDHYTGQHGAHHVGHEHMEHREHHAHG
jgi:hypothetical protein